MLATLTTTWIAAVLVPGGQPAADQAFTQGLKPAAEAATVATFNAIAGASDLHTCTIPVPPMPHGPGLVTKASSTVMINGLPAARQGDNVMEACGGGDPISMGFPTVDIGG
ncbi:MAG: PAAR domain-containing protein [Planctomycetes bacterium]|nr:PAAR domain-containing protein [Planctomycetota bacterium]